MSTMLAKPPALFDPAEVQQALRIFAPAGEVVEIRILGATLAGDRRQHSVVFGYFDAHAKLVSALESVVSATGIYFTLNAINPALLARGHNRLRPAGKGETTSDSDVVARCWLPIDTDAKRPAGISATDDEHDAAIARAREIAQYLSEQLGWPAPVVADSGNGGHLCYAVDLPTDDGALVQRCLESLAARFNDSSVKVDTSVFNPARIWKLYGTLAAKGDATTERPHRLAKLLDMPEELTVVTRQQLETLAADAPEPSKSVIQISQANGHVGSFDLDAFIGRYLPDAKGPTPWKGSGRSWELPQSPMCDHHDGAAWLTQQPSGAIAAGCRHNSCGWDWHDLRQKLEPRAVRNGDHRDNRQAQTMPNPADVAAITVEDVAPLAPINVATLIVDHPKLAEPVIDGLLRRGETGNIIADPKRGKSWLAYGLIQSVATGDPWLGKFPCPRGRVLLIDNELHLGTLAHRIPKVAEAMAIEQSEYAERLDVLSLRGRLVDLYGIADIVDRIEPGSYDLVVLDAFYRSLPPQVSENDNAEVAQLYNLIDKVTERLGCAWINIHHATKGDQSHKSITDVGAGAGSQSRAADAHIILRPHETEGAVVLEAVVRSFPPVAPVVLRWDFPIWRRDDVLDPKLVRGRLTKAEERQSDKDKDGLDKLRVAHRQGASNDQGT